MMVGVCREFSIEHLRNGATRIMRRASGLASLYDPKTGRAWNGQAQYLPRSVVLQIISEFDAIMRSMS